MTPFLAWSAGSLSQLLLRLGYGYPVPWLLIALPLACSMHGECRVIYTRMREVWYSSSNSDSSIRHAVSPRHPTSDTAQQQHSRRFKLLLASDALMMLCMGATLLAIVAKLSGVFGHGIGWLAVLAPMWVQGRTWIVLVMYTRCISVRL